MKGIPLDQRDEDWELKKEELERNPPCSWENYTSSAPKKNRKKKREAGTRPAYLVPLTTGNAEQRQWQTSDASAG